jgi:Xaa-Pro aminopeptidase
LISDLRFTDADLDALYAKCPYPRFSPQEYQRRYTNIRAMMAERGLDCLLIVGGTAAYGRMWANVRYVTNMVGGKADQTGYVIFPKEGEPLPFVRGHATAKGMLAQSVVHRIGLAGHDLLAAVAGGIAEFGYANGHIGIVAYDPNTSIPQNHWEYFRSKLPRAEFSFVTREYLALRLIKSQEEIDCLERSSLANDAGIRALAARARPGATERQLFAAVYEAAILAGGEMGMIQLASGAMDEDDVNDQRPRPCERVLGPRDLINNELGIFYNGYEGQSGKPIVTGPPTPRVREMFDVALEAYRAIAATLVPGKGSQDSVRAAQCIRDAGYEAFGGFIQGMHGNHPRHEPEVGFGDRGGSRQPFTYQEGMVFVVQPHIVDRDETISLFLGDTFAITADGPRCLNRLPPALIQV